MSIETNKDPPESYTFQSISWSHLIFMRMSSFLSLKGRSFLHPLSLMLQLVDNFVIMMCGMMYTGYGVRIILDRGEMEIEYICEEIVIMCVVLRYYVLYLKRKQLCRAVESCERLWGYLLVGEDIIVRQFERKGNFLRNLMLFLAMFSAGAYILMAPFIRLPPLEANGTERRMLPFKFFVDVQKEPAYSIVFVVQSIGLQYFELLIGSIETVSLYLIMMACGYLRSVRIRLMSFEGSDDDTSETGEAAFKFVVSCAHFHQQIMIFCEDLASLTQTLFLFACFCPIYNVSITGIVLLNDEEDKLKFAPVMIYNFLQFFLCQWAPEHLYEESAVIAEAAYFASAQPLASSHRQKIHRILYFMMMRAQKPVRLTAGGFAPLSIETFGSMTKSAFSFFMVLRSFKS